MFHGRSELAFFCFAFVFVSRRGHLKFLYLSYNCRLTVTYLFISLAVAESWLGTNSILGSIFMQLSS